MKQEPYLDYSARVLRGRVIRVRPVQLIETYEQPPRHQYLVGHNQVDGLKEGAEVEITECEPLVYGYRWKVKVL